MLERRDELLDLLQLEGGKTRRHAFEEVLDAAMVSRYYACSAKNHLRPRKRRGAFPVLTATQEYHHPVGVVGIISPWNYPLTLSIRDAVPALAAGNAVVIKADSQTPFSALWGAALLEEAGLPADLLQVVTGSGSVAGQAAERLIPSSMELGGKNAMIVLEDAPLKRGLEGAERALFSNAGQLCISVERLLVHEAIADEFIARLVDRVRSMRLGSSLGYDDDMGH